MLLYRAQLFLEEGQPGAALRILHALPEDSTILRERDYLLGWCFTQQTQWDAAASVLRPLCEQTTIAGEEEALRGRGHASGRERHALCLLRLGDSAINLCHPADALRHYLACLAIAHTLPDGSPFERGLRIKARRGQGTACCMLGLYEPALQHYRAVLALCLASEDEEEQAHTCYGLCYAYQQAGRLAEALITGQQALDLYVQHCNLLFEVRMRQQLGRVCFLLGDFAQAEAYYQQSLALSTCLGQVRMVILNSLALAELRAAQKNFSRARTCLRSALALADQAQSDYLLGQLYLVVGKVTQAEAETRCQGSPRRRLLLERACASFARGQQHLAGHQAYSAAAELYSHWAEALEALQRPQEALQRWLTAYAMQAAPKGVPWY